MRLLRLTRRGLLRTGALTGAASLLGRGAAAAAAARRGATTLGSVLVKGPPGRGGYRRLVRRDGERHLLRADLGVRPKPGRRRRRQPVLAFVQLSDVHVLDAQSPLRVEWTDRYDDDTPLPSTGIFTSAYRPGEILTAQVADAMVRRINQVRRGPVTDRPLALAIQTGDNSDNAQYNEIRWNIDLLDGGRIRADSGDLTRWEGVADQNPLYYDPHYWHPDGAPDGKPVDKPRQQYGFPKVPGLLGAARRPFRAAGLRMPWYSVFGNHDVLAQGNFPPYDSLSAMATGRLKIISPPAGMTPGEALAAILTDLPGLLDRLAATPSVRVVSPDPDRRLLKRRQIVAEHFRTTGTPRGHGFTDRNRRSGTAYYTFDVGRQLRFVVLDTVNPNGYANGSIDQAQLAWLKRVLDRSRHRAVLVFSHHTSETMDNPLRGTGGDTEPRVLGPQVLQTLLAHPHVVAWVNGHTHRNGVRAHRRSDGRGGLWEVNTASHIDWPQQSRIIEILDNRDGTMSIFCTMLDHASPARYGGRLGDPTHLAALGRELAANDWHQRASQGRGTRLDRNVELVVRRPRGLRR